MIFVWGFAMSDATSSEWGIAPPFPADERAKHAPKPHWPLMGDVVSARVGVPEHLIQWRRARGEDDPEPRL